LIEAFERECKLRAFSRMLLTVHPGNLRAVAFYRKAGWSPARTSRDSLMMEKRLSPVGAEEEAPVAALRQLLSGLRVKGIRNSLKLLWMRLEDRAFDIYHGTSTWRRVPLGRLTITSENKGHGAKYDGSPVSPLRKVLQGLEVTREDVFVDFGSGKGRALLIASSFPFRRVVGVEFACELCTTARANAAIYASRNKGAAPIEIVEEDAVKFCVQPEHTVFYFFNPFDQCIMQSVLQGIVGSWRQRPRRMFVIYYHPMHRGVIDACDLFHLQRDYEIMARRFLVYST
jgi:SAM-dependent methyltransferase